MKRWGGLVAVVFGVGLAIGVGAASLRPVPVTKRPAVAGVQATPVPTPTQAPKIIILAAVGDVMLGRSVQEQMEKRGDFGWPWAEVGQRLAAADLTVGNLEAAIVPGCTQAENRFKFCAKPETIPGMAEAGFDVWSQANNHSYNYGREGYEGSVEILAQAGMAVTDPERLVIKEVEGIKLGFLGFDDVTQELDLAEAGAAIASASAQVEVMIPMVHWGVEYVDNPTERQQEVAQMMAGAGADLIIGSHPHWVQGVDKLGETLVFWSLGNMVFDQMWSEETRQGAIAEIRVRITDYGLQTIEYELVPVKIYEFGQPRFE